MELWAKTTLILCVFGVLKEFRPSEPFVTPYLLEPWKNFTDVQVNQQIYPVGTYSYLSLLVLVFLVTDLLRYKPVILLEGFSGIITYILLIVGKNIPAMQAVQFFYGMFMATEVAYYTYIYAQVDREHYQKVTSYTRAAFLLGRFSSGVVAQALVSTDTLNYYYLNFLTLGGMCCATLWAVFLPPAQQSIYFHRQDVSISKGPSGTNNLAFEADVSALVSPEVNAGEVVDSLGSHKKKSFTQKCVTAYGLLWMDFKAAFTNPYVVKWSFWWSLATCGFFQGITYIQVLWDAIVKESATTDGEFHLYNGAVEALYTVLGAAAAFGCGWLRFNWQVLGEASLAVGALIQGAALIVSAYANNMWLAYSCYIVFGVVYYTMITIVNSEVAKYINEDSYGLIFGINTFFALVLQTILTSVVAAEGGLALAARPQFLVYGGYFVVLGAIFTVMAVITLCAGKLHDQPLWLPKEPSSIPVTAPDLILKIS